MTAVTRHARHLSLARAEQAAGQAFGLAEDGVGAATAGLGRVAVSAAGGAFAVAVAATLAWVL
ncbi:hypothetical protein VQ02_11385 [Methylobacterium variabile]|jgi:hypothetical protein|uniref:Uncharacterized protein n=1 Tax=Methylobacterium variabile TaxID=298794 RepID=A0A0J6SU21_9HYPH|nr:hypothetical protein [Methylobacterium variabile]KMO38770.1 hypothetical protein VQ02_11385 [Methylobacterium variabile]